MVAVFIPRTIQICKSMLAFKTCKRRLFFNRLYMNYIQHQHPVRSPFSRLPEGRNVNLLTQTIFLLKVCTNVSVRETRHAMGLIHCFVTALSQGHSMIAPLSDRPAQDIYILSHTDKRAKGALLARAIPPDLGHLCHLLVTSTSNTKTASRGKIVSEWETLMHPAISYDFERWTHITLNHVYKLNVLHIVMFISASHNFGSKT